MYKKILIPTDGSVLGDIAAREGINLAAKLGAEVVCIHVAREYQNPGFKSKPVSSEEYEAVTKEAGEKILHPLEILAEKAGVKFTGVLYMANHAAYAIVKAGREKGCDLIFIGSNGCAGWHHILMGSVSNKVLASAETSVLVYRLKENEVPDNVSDYSDSVYVFPPA